jgi:5-methyltetrahydrofolate--homocysteine methyltransferase
VHRAYVAAGSEVVTTNTFGANALKLDGAATVDAVFEAAIRCAKRSGARYVAADIGPSGALLEPMGTYAFDDAYELFAEQARAAAAHGADLFIIETMTDLLEMKAALLACKEQTDLPIFATMTFEENGRTFLGTSPEVAALALSALGANVVGINCSLGPAQLAPLVRTMLAYAPCPVMLQANAGLPSMVDGRTVYSISPASYVGAVEPLIEAGVTVVGGCCGTDPDYIALERAALERHPVPERTVERHTALTSAQNAVVLHGSEVGVIGERINPTGKPKLKAALRAGNWQYAVGEALAQAEAGADLLDVNAGLPEIDEAAALVALVREIQGVCGLPLQIDSSDPVAVEAAVRSYAGKPLINSVNGKRDNLAAILPIVKHYGCAVVGLTLDEGGIPPTAEERVAIAEKIVNAAASHGIPREDVLIDCLVMSASTNQREVGEILKAVRLVKERLGCRTVLGVSNVSFGLPARPIVNATFLAAAFSAGLDLPILNPPGGPPTGKWSIPGACSAGRTRGRPATSRPTRTTRRRPLPQRPRRSPIRQRREQPHPTTRPSALAKLVIAGNKGDVPAVVEAMLDDTDALSVIDDHLIPALDEVGRRFEAGTFFLPQLMAASEAAKAGFDVIRERTPAAEAVRGPIAVATVKGDIHDIGKNIVKMLLENYGYAVIDLGRDVEPQAVLDCVRAHDVKIVGLSALMTSTVTGMKETIDLLHAHTPQVKIMVGGAVLNAEYAQMVGADFYAKDAAESAKFAAQVLG